MARVLYVDDESAIRRAVAGWLGRRGHDVETAADLTTARSHLEAAGFDVVFIDLWIGEESGLELYKWLRDVDPATAARVAFVTGDPFDHSLADLGTPQPVFTKPFELRKLEEHALLCARRGDAGHGDASAHGDEGETTRM